MHLLRHYPNYATIMALFRVNRSPDAAGREKIRLTTFRRRQVICPSCYFAAALGN
jgi:hypothetical protein